MTIFSEPALRKDLTVEGNIKTGIYSRIDPGAVDRITNNLIDNAIKYTEPDGKQFDMVFSSFHDIAERFDFSELVHYHIIFGSGKILILYGISQHVILSKVIVFFLLLLSRSLLQQKPVIKQEQE